MIEYKTKLHEALATLKAGRAIANCEKAIFEYETGLEIEKDMEINNGTK